VLSESPCYNLFMNEIITFILVGLAGWVAGAVINYLADVLPYRRRLAAPFCLICEEKIPLVNYLFFPRECPDCGSVRRARTWFVEILSIAAAVWMWQAPPVGLGFGLGLFLLVYFGVVVVIDLEYRLILHPVSIVGAMLGLVIGTWQHGILETLIGGALGFGLMLAFYYLGSLFSKVIARRRGGVGPGEALGFGDVNLGGVLGLMLGWPLILPALFLAILIGGVVSLAYMLGMLLLRRYQALMAVPYGPFLVSGAALLIYFRDAVLSWLFP
jgi:leader peptidase (prepilin peptidase) / N-methyltransferase